MTRKVKLEKTAALKMKFEAVTTGYVYKETSRKMSTRKEGKTAKEENSDRQLENH